MEMEVRFRWQVLVASQEARRAVEASGLSHPVPAYLTQSVFKVVLQKSIPTRIRQLVIYISSCKGKVDDFVEELTY